MKVLILGHEGLLGNMVKSYLEKNEGLTVITSDTRWPSLEFKNSIIDTDADYIINCIGAIHQKTSEFSVNTDLPIWLDLNSKSRIIHPGTDCEMDSDSYGISKRKASDYIKERGERTKIIKTSIIGPEKNTTYSLMSWFLSNPENSTVKGFSRHLWNGNTTLTWAEYCLLLILDWENFKKETVLSSECVSKFDILEAINEVYGRKINIIDDDKPGVNKCLIGDISTPHIKNQLEILKNYVG
jgi:dTDP-4-dehydrorhamnose reductase